MDNKYSEPVLLEKSDNYGMNIKVFDQNRKAIIAGSAAEPLAIWDLQTGKQLSQLDIQSGNAEAFDFIDENKCLIGVRENIRLYDMNTLNIIKTYSPILRSSFFGDVKVRHHFNSAAYSQASLFRQPGYLSKITVYSISDSKRIFE